MVNRIEKLVRVGYMFSIFFSLLLFLFLFSSKHLGLILVNNSSHIHSKTHFEFQILLERGSRCSTDITILSLWLHVLSRTADLNCSPYRWRPAQLQNKGPSGLVNEIKWIHTFTLEFPMTLRRLVGARCGPGLVLVQNLIPIFLPRI